MAESMTMRENDALVNDRKEVVANDGSSQNSPWKKPVVMPAVSPVMGEKIWPSLTDVQSAKAAETLNIDSKVTQNLDGHKKSNVGVNANSKHFQPRYSRGRPKKSQNTGPPFPVPVVARLPYPPPGSFLPPVRGYENFYQPMPAPFPIANNCFSKSGSHIPKNSFTSPHPNMDHGQNFHPPAQIGQAVNPPKYSPQRPHNTAEIGGYYCFPRPFPFGPKGSINMQENMAPRAYMRPTSIRPPMFVGGPLFPGRGHMRYSPVPPPYFIRAPFPHLMPPNLVNPWAPPDVLALKEAIVKQIEYYFSDENLLTDRYLLAQMDDQGWVPISVIAEFKRVKRMCTDIQFILDALQRSSSVEVQGNKLRKYDSSSKNAEKMNEIANGLENNLSSQDSTSSDGKEQPNSSPLTDPVTEGAEMAPSVVSNGLPA